MKYIVSHEDKLYYMITQYGYVFPDYQIEQKKSAPLWYFKTPQLKDGYAYIHKAIYTNKDLQSIVNDLPDNLEDLDLEHWIDYIQKLNDPDGYEKVVFTYKEAIDWINHNTIVDDVIVRIYDNELGCIQSSFIQIEYSQDVYNHTMYRLGGLTIKQLQDAIKQSGTEKEFKKIMRDHIKEEQSCTW